MEKESNNRPKNFHRQISGVILFSILIYGVFRIWVLQFYTLIFTKLLLVTGLETEMIRSFFQDNSQGSWEEYKIGWVLYYPTYFLLHILFIYFLFTKEIKTRNMLIIGLTTLIGALLIFIIIGKVFDFKIIYDISWNLFRSLFGLPFILLAIEGGRILHADMKKRIDDVQH